ncbi:MAG: hypothetical protein A4E55_02208 [Pelotomaculum sp. PtaU1.Bin035]|nr:MAG: hypothetical protein A4E55_02208 [Pelotomaculum sp. PtaU1.Bin035]
MGIRIINDKFYQEVLKDELPRCLHEKSSQGQESPSAVKSGYGTLQPAVFQQETSSGDSG